MENEVLIKFDNAIQAANFMEWFQVAGCQDYQRLDESPLDIEYDYQNNIINMVYE